MTTEVCISLVSHTNVGKTTLARTLLRRDVGEVLDGAHVTEASEGFVLLEAGGAVLRLWDTPGFGDSVRLLDRLRGEGNPLGWLLSQVWDRLTDRPFYCSQEAVRSVREHADVVLYLVSAAEEPGDAGYVGPELELLGWVGRPVLVLVNQTGETDIDPGWSALVEAHEVVRAVLPLDAFSRCWVQEGVLLDQLVQVVAPEKRPALVALRTAWTDRNLETLAESVRRMAAYLAAAALERAPIQRGGAPGRSRTRALDALAGRLHGATLELVRGLVAAHGLEGRAVAVVEATLDDLDAVVTGRPVRTGLWGLMSAAAGGAVTGLAADLAAGGLTLGGGALLGGILGLATGLGAARGWEWATGSREARWTAAFLDRLFAATLLRYLAVAHFGRGQGDFRTAGVPAAWEAEVRAATEAREPDLHRAWGDPKERARLEALVDETLRELLAGRYPEAAGML